MLKFQLRMESQQCNFIKFNQEPFYNVPPLLESIPHVLASPDTEIAAKHPPRMEILARVFLHKDLV